MTPATDKGGQLVSVMPCKDCKERYKACWGSCATYQEARAKWDAVRQEQLKQQKTEYDLNSVKYHSRRRY